PSPQLQQQSLEFTSFALSLKRDRGTRGRSEGSQAPVRRGIPVDRYISSTQTADRGARDRAGDLTKVVATVASACAWDKQEQRREGPTSARTIRVHRAPPFVRGARARQHYNNSQEERPLRWQECVPASEEVTSLVRALALHGVAMLRSHLASTLRPGSGVLIRSVSRRLGSVACVREDASPNEVSNLTNSRMPVSLPGCQTGVEQTQDKISCHQA